MTSISVEARNLREVQRNMEKALRDMHGEPILQAMRDSTMMVDRDAKIEAPVDTGRLRASITPEVEEQDDEVIGIVGSNVEYAPYQELGTRKMKAHPYLHPAYEKNRDRIIERLRRAAKELGE